MNEIKESQNIERDWNSMEVEAILSPNQRNIKLIRVDNKEMIKEKV